MFSYRPEPESDLAEVFVPNVAGKKQSFGIILKATAAQWRFAVLAKRSFLSDLSTVKICNKQNHLNAVRLTCED
jgi:hypothetical protein